MRIGSMKLAFLFILLMQVTCYASAQIDHKYAIAYQLEQEGRDSQEVSLKIQKLFRNTISGRLERDFAQIFLTKINEFNTRNTSLRMLIDFYEPTLHDKFKALLYLDSITNSLLTDDKVLDHIEEQSLNIEINSIARSLKELNAYQELTREQIRSYLQN